MAEQVRTEDVGEEQVLSSSSSSSSSTRFSGSEVTLCGRSKRVLPLLFAALVLFVQVNLFLIHPLAKSFLLAGDESSVNKDFSGQWKNRTNNYTGVVPPTETRIRVQYEIHKGRTTFPNAFDRRYMCRLRNRRPLPPSLAQALEYRTQVQSDLNVVLMGDSVAMQIAGAYQRANGEHPKNNPRSTLFQKFGYEILTHARTGSAGGGHVFGWRLTSMWLRAKEGWPVRSRKRQGGWNRGQAELLRNITTTAAAAESNRTVKENGTSSSSSSSNGTATLTTTTTNMDALVFRIPQGWISLDDVTNASLDETVHLAYELLGVSCVTFMTMPLINNYDTLQDIEEMKKTNQRIHDFADNWNLQSKVLTGNLPLVLVLNFGELINVAAHVNGKMLGLGDNGTQTNDANELFVNDRVSYGEWTRPAALVCAEKPANSTKSCALNHLSADGVHICMETFSGRMFAALACQHACVYNTQEGHSRTAQDKVTCSKQCNHDYMGLDPIPNSTLGRMTHPLGVDGLDSSIVQMAG